MKLIQRLARDYVWNATADDLPSSIEIKFYESIYEAGFRKAREMAAEIPKNQDISYYDEDIKAAVLMHSVQCRIEQLGESEVE